MKTEYKNESEHHDKYLQRHSSIIGKIFWGLLIIGVAAVLLLNGLGIDMGTQDLPLVRIVGSILLLAIAVSSLTKFKFVLFFVPLALIAYLWRFDYMIPNNFKLWPVLGAAVLLGIGMSVIFHRRSHIHVSINAEDGAGRTEETLNENEAVDIDASWGDHIKYIHADNLKRAQIKTSFASTKIFFDQCKVSPEGLEINVNASFCELVLNVPRDWMINNHISTFAGDIKSMQPSRADNGIKVNLTGSINFAELRINYI